MACATIDVYKKHVLAMIFAEVNVTELLNLEPSEKCQLFVLATNMNIYFLF